MIKIDYNAQAEKFLTDTKTTLEVVRAVPQTSPLWCKGEEKHGIKYSVTLKNARHSYIFPFWDSIKNAEFLELAEEAGRRGYDSSYSYALRDEIIKRELNINIYRFRTKSSDTIKAIKEALKPKAYDIIACLSISGCDTFKDFCDCFGYDEDSRKAEKTWQAVQEQENNLHKLFDHSELERLNEIN